MGKEQMQVELVQALRDLGGAGSTRCKGLCAGIPGRHSKGRRVCSQSESGRRPNRVARSWMFTPGYPGQSSPLPRRESGHPGG